MAAGHVVHVLRFGQLHVPVQHDIHVSLLPDAGGGLVSRAQRRFRDDVPVWRPADDGVCVLRQSGVPGAGVHDHAGVCVVETQSVHSDELFRCAELPGAVSAVGVVGLFGDTGQHDLGGSDGHGGGAFVLFPGGCVPAAAGRFSDSVHAVVSVSICEIWRWIRVRKLIAVCANRRKLFNELPWDDAAYVPLPEDRPGGFNWAEGDANNPAGAAAAAAGGGGDANPDAAAPQAAAPADRQQ